MLPPTARLTDGQDFRSVVRRGRRAGRRRLVVYVLADRAGSTRVGFIVSKAVGNSVVRHRVTRRLRHVMRDRLALLPAGSDFVVRALGPAAAASSVVLGNDLDGAFGKLGLLTAKPGDVL